MKKKTKITIGIVIVALICITLGALYVNKFLLPAKVEGFLSKLLEEKTGYKIRIARINYLPPSQFYIRDVALYNATSPSGKPVHADTVSLDFQLWPLLKEKAFIAQLGLKDLTYSDIRINGSISFVLKRRASPARRGFLKNLDGTAEFTNFSLKKTGSFINIGGLTGKVAIKDNLINIDKTFFNYKNKIYNIEGAVRGLEKDEPEAFLSLNSEILTSEGNFVLKDDYIEIRKIDGAAMGTSFNIMGDIKYAPLPSFNIYCKAKLDLADLKKLFPQYKYISKPLKPAGICNLAIFFNGSPARLELAEASIKLDAKKAFLYGLALDDLYLDLMMKDGIINTRTFSLRPYFGLFNGSLNIDLTQKNMPYTASFALKDANLAKFSADMNFGQENMSGFLSSKFLLKGSLTSRDSLHGSGWVTVTDGQLWEWPILGGILNLLEMPYIRSVVFKEAAGNFIVGERKITTKDLTFYSDKLNLSAKGYVDLDGNIDVVFRTNITGDLVQGASDAAKIANLFLTQAGSYIGRIRITGTLKKPKFVYASQSIKETVGEEIKKIKKIGGLLKDILQ